MVRPGRLKPDNSIAATAGLEGQLHPVNLENLAVKTEAAKQSGIES
jgi:hypothetical protein